MTIKQWLTTRYFLRAVRDLLVYFLNYFIINFRIFLKNSILYPGVKIIGARRIKIGRDVVIRENCYFFVPEGGLINIGNDIFIGMSCIIDGTGGVTIGDGVGIGPHALIFSQSHNIDNKEVRSGEQGFITKGIRIGSNVLIGANATILDGVNIGEGVFVGAGSVVTEDIPPFTIAAGVPARVIKYRK